MADIAQLGLAVDSSQVEKGTLSLDQLSGAAKRAQAASEGVSSSTKGASTAVNAAGVAADKASSFFGRLADAAKRFYAWATKARDAASSIPSALKPVNDNVNRMGGSMSGLAAQFQDIGVTAAMGMNPVMIALQQGTQIAGQMEAAVQGGSSAVSVLGNAFKSLFSPLTFVSIILTAIAAAALQMVDWTNLAAYALNGLASVIGTIAPYAAGAAAGLALVYAPAVFMGFAALTGAVAAASRAVIGMAVAFAAANPAAALVIGLVAAVAALNVFRDEIAQIFGRDIIGDVKNAINWIVGGFVGAFNAIKQSWSLLPAAIGDTVYSAANATISGVETMINKVGEYINSFIAGINSALKSLPFGIGENINIGTVGKVSFGRVDNPYAGAAGQVREIEAKAFKDAQSKDYVGGAIDVIAKGASAASAKLRELAADMTNVDDKSKKGKGSKDKTDPYKEIVDGANRRIATLRAEQEALGMTEEAALALQNTQDLLNQAQQKGITLTAAQKAELAALGSQMAATEIATKRMKETQDAAKDAAHGFGGVLRGLLDGTASWKDALLSLIPIVLKLLNTMNGGNLFGGGIFQSLIGGLLGMQFAKGGVFQSGNVVPFAKGGVVSSPTVFPFAKGIGLMGEAGPEAIMPLRRGPDGRLGVSAANQNMQAQTVHVEVDVRGMLVDDNGVIKAKVETMGRQAAQAGSAMAVKQVNNHLLPMLADSQLRRV